MLDAEARVEDMIKRMIVKGKGREEERELEKRPKKNDVLIRNQHIPIKDNNVQLNNRN